MGPEGDGNGQAMLGGRHSERDRARTGVRARTESPTRTALGSIIYFNNVVGNDRVSNTVGDLLVKAGIMSVPSGLSTFTSKHLRHHFATICQRLRVEDGLMEKSEVLAALRHAGGGSLKYYTAVDVHPDVRSRYNNVPVAQRRKDGRSQRLRY